jgi:tRNA-2-methylthio-N6-dimethylallyladenosine synthase
MNRTHTAADYLQLIEKIRRARPDIALSGDFIVGFPGEREADFQRTLDLVSEVGYAAAFAFKYSKRPGTPASAALSQVAESVKIDRLAQLNALLHDQQTRFNAALVGKSVPVLFERPGRKSHQIVGRSPYLQPVWVLGSEDMIGQIAEVKITEATHGSLSGALMRAPDEVAA